MAVTGAGADGASMSKAALIAGLGVEEVSENLRTVEFEVRKLAWAS